MPHCISHPGDDCTADKNSHTGKPHPPPRHGGTFFRVLGHLSCSGTIGNGHHGEANRRHSEKSAHPYNRQLNRTAGRNGKKPYGSSCQNQGSEKHPWTPPTPSRLGFIRKISHQRIGDDVKDQYSSSDHPGNPNRYIQVGGQISQNQKLFDYDKDDNPHIGKPPTCPLAHG